MNNVFYEQNCKYEHHGWSTFVHCTDKMTLFASWRILNNKVNGPNAI